MLIDARKWKAIHVHPDSKRYVKLQHYFLDVKRKQNVMSIVHADVLLYPVILEADMQEVMS